jgi:thiamine-phosphate pyrophosphorylase
LHYNIFYMLYYRIIDVNINRAREATRVIEDYARFILEDPESYNQVRLIRHNLLKTLSVLSPKLLHFRDIEMDPGKTNSNTTKNLPEIIISNFRRLSEALRSITEYLKIQSPNLAAQVEKLRFNTYQLEQRFFYSFYPKKLLYKMRLYILVPERLANHPIEKIIPELIKGGADAIQLRADNSEDITLLKLARKIRSLTLSKNVIFIVNDRVDIALLSQADGVHLGKMDISIHDARRLLGPDKIIGATSHSIKEALDAEKNGADYISVGPFFTSLTKPLLEPHGFDYIKNISKCIHIPYIAVGGINRTNLPGLSRTHQKLFKYPIKIAVSSAILSSKDICRTAKSLKKSLGN